VYLKTGKVDTLLLGMLVEKTINIGVVEILVIIFLKIGIARWRKKRKVGSGR